MQNSQYMCLCYTKRSEYSAYLTSSSPLHRCSRSEFVLGNEPAFLEVVCAFPNITMWNSAKWIPLPVFYYSKPYHLRCRSLIECMLAHSSSLNVLGILTITALQHNGIWLNNVQAHFSPITAAPAGSTST